MCAYAVQSLAECSAMGFNALNHESESTMGLIY